MVLIQYCNDAVVASKKGSKDHQGYNHGGQATEGMYNCIYRPICAS